MDTRKTPLQIGFRQVSWLVSRKWSGKLHFLCPLYSRNVSQNWAQWLLKSTKYFSYRLKYKVEKYHYRYCRFLQFPVEWFHRCWTHLQTYWDAFSVVYITGGWMLQWHCRRNHTDMNKQMTWHDGVDQGLCHFFLWCGLKSLKNKKNQIIPDWQESYSSIGFHDHTIRFLYLLRERLHVHTACHVAPPCFCSIPCNRQSNQTLPLEACFAVLVVIVCEVWMRGI